MAAANKETPLARFLKEHLPDVKLRLPNSVWKAAGRKLKAGRPEEEILACLMAGTESGNAQPPAKCLVVGMSRPLDEWPITKFSRALQAYVCGTYVPDPEDPKKRVVIGGITKSERDTLVLDDLQRKEHQQAWFKRIGIDSCGLKVQDVNAVIKHALKRYDGVEVKVKNRNAKALSKWEHENERRRAEGRKELPPIELQEAFNEEGRLVQPPGFNPNIYFSQQSNFRAVHPKKDSDILAAIGLQSYSKMPDQPIPVGKQNGGSVVDRLAIPKGEPGHIPEHQRAEVNPLRKRIRQRSHAKAAGILLGIAHMGSDWIVFDLRGLLRNVRWRKIANRCITPSELVGLFTGDPVVDPVRNIVTCLYKAESIRVWSQKPVTGKSNEVLLREAPVTLISVDIGVTNPIAVKASYVTKVSDKLSATMRARFSYEDIAKLTKVGTEFLDDIQHLKRGHDSLNASINQMAEAALSAEQQAEIRMIRASSAEAAKAKVVERYGIDPQQIPWDRINNRTYFIADAVLKQDPTSTLVYEEREGKKKKGKNGEVKQAPTQMVKMKDAWIAHSSEIRPRLSDETRKALQDKTWEIQRTHQGYNQLSKRKQELARKIRNQVIERARKATGVEKVAVNVERLNIKGLQGRGKRPDGWNALFQAKQENRWLMQALHKAFLEVAEKGMIVIASRPERTSITCTKCGHVDADNRNGTDFKCLKCGFMANTDLEIATDNLERVALTGLAMPKAAKSGQTSCEHRSDGSKAKGARKGQPSGLVGTSSGVMHALG